MMNPPRPPTKTQTAASIYKTIKGELHTMSPALWVIIGVVLGAVIGSR